MILMSADWSSISRCIRTSHWKLRNHHDGRWDGIVVCNARGIPWRLVRVEGDRRGNVRVIVGEIMLVVMVGGLLGNDDARPTVVDFSHQILPKSYKAIQCPRCRILSAGI